MNQVAHRRTGTGTGTGTGTVVVVAAAAAAAVTGYAWWATGLRPFTLASLTAVIAAGGVATTLGALLIPRDLRPVRLPHPWVRLGVAAAVGLWELTSFLQHPRSEHPTLSSLTNTVFASHPARTLGLLLWLAFGAWLARRTTPARPFLGRALPVLGFLWLGWHVFVRAGY